MRRRALRSDSGAAAVEFALVSVLLFTLLFGTVQYGYFFFQATAAEHAAREGAREAAVGIDDCGAWQTLVTERGGAADVTSASAEGGAARGDEIIVRVNWERVDFGFPFVPFLGGTTQEETALTRAERLGDITGGCS